MKKLISDFKKLFTPKTTFGKVGLGLFIVVVVAVGYVAVTGQYLWG